MLEIMNYVFDVLLIVIYLVPLLVFFKVSRKMYGGRFTTVIPHIFVGAVLMLSISMINLVGLAFPVLRGSVYFIFSLQTLQVLAGLFFINALYQIYQIRYATEGFREG